MPILSERIYGRFPGETRGHVTERDELGLENWKRSTRWRDAIVEIGRPSLRVHDLRHTYASLSRRAGADLRLLQKAMGHASITVTAHIYADLYDDELDDIATALDALEDTSADLVANAPLAAAQFRPDIGPMNRPRRRFDSNGDGLNCNETWWPGAGSNRRPSAFQADAHTD